MKSALALPPNDLAILLAGDPGMRKSTLALQFPNVYIFDADKNVGQPLEFLKKTDPTLPARTFTDNALWDREGKPLAVQQRWLWMIKCVNEAFADPWVKTVVIDSLSALVEMAVSEVKRQAGRADNLEMRIQDWGAFGALLRNFITMCRAQNKIFICTAHQKFEQDEADKQWKIFLNIPGQAATNLSGMFTDVWNLYLAIEGLGSAQKHTGMVRTMPSSLTDHRGLKNSFGLKVSQTTEEVVKVIRARFKDLYSAVA